jgi:hypothetical protein
MPSRGSTRAWLRHPIELRWRSDWIFDFPTARRVDRHAGNRRVSGA